jgi:hypothetical protein
MKVLALQAIGIEGVPDGSYAFADASGGPAEVVVVAGRPASGKTRLLELLLLVRELIAPTNDEADEEAWVRLGGSSARVIVTFWLEEHERKKLGYATPTVVVELVLGADPELVAPVEPDPGLVFLLESYDHTPDTIKLEYFAESRRLDVGGGSIALEAQSQKPYRTSKDPRKFSFIPDYLRSLQSEREAAERFERLLRVFSPALTLDRLRAGLESLSSSERDALLLSATSSLVSLSHSVVLVDRPDLYIRDEARMLRGLLSLGRSNQLFVTSYSSQLFRAAESCCVIDL